MSPRRLIVNTFRLGAAQRAESRARLSVFPGRARRFREATELKLFRVAVGIFRAPVDLFVSSCGPLLAPQGSFVEPQWERLQAPASSPFPSPGGPLLLSKLACFELVGRVRALGGLSEGPVRAAVGLFQAPVLPLVALWGLFEPQGNFLEPTGELFESQRSFFEPQGSFFELPEGLL